MDRQEGHLLHVCAAPTDEAWVRGYLLPALSLGEHQVHTRREDRLGRSAVIEIVEAMTHCRFTLLVLSRAFLADEWTAYAACLASHCAVTREQLLLVARERCELPLHLEFRVRVELLDGESWEEQLARLRGVLGQATPPEDDDIPCPYPGLPPFEAEEGALFFGREDEVEDLYSRLTRPVSERARQIFLIGPSGSGKSSLLRAGLLPCLARHQHDPRKPQFTTVRVRPGERPMAALASALRQADEQSHAEAVAALLDGADLRRLVLLIVDPLEEIFTLAKDGEAEQFLAALGDLRDEPRCALVALMRADFYPQLMASSIWPIGEERRFELGPLRDGALRKAIHRPAAARRVYVEPALLERLVLEAGHGVGVLPLLQETLVLLWERRRQRGERRLLTLASYEGLSRPDNDDLGKSSALHVALARHADAVIADLPRGAESLARRILLRLVQLGEGGPDTRRQQSESALRATGDNPDRFEQVLAHLAAGRLVTLVAAPVSGSERLVDLSHDALIGGWPRLTGWLKELREHEQRRRRLENRAREWLRLGGRRSGLLDREELPEFEVWIASDILHQLGIPVSLEAFVAASRAELRRRRRSLWAAGFTLVVSAAVVSVLTISLIRQNAAMEESTAAASQAILALSRSYEALGDLYETNGNVAQAVSFYQNSLRVSFDLAESVVGNAKWKNDLFVYGRLYGMYMVGQKFPDALRVSQERLAIAQRLAEREPSDTGWQWERMLSYGMLGRVYVATGRHREALRSYHDALAIGQRLVKRDPDNPDWQLELSILCESLGAMYMAAGRVQDALSSFHSSLAIRRRRGESDPGNTNVQKELVTQHLVLAERATSLHIADEARRHVQSAAEILSILERGDKLSADAHLMALRSYLAQVRRKGESTRHFDPYGG